MEETIICFRSVTEVIMAEQALSEGKFSVRVMPAPANIRPGCGFCLRLMPEDQEKAVSFLSGRGFSTTETYMRTIAEGQASYKRTSPTEQGKE